MYGRHLKRKLLDAFPAGTAVLLTLSASLLIGAPSGAQISGFASAGTADATVSVQDLRVSSKARGEFERGLRRLAKQDPGGSLRHFSAAIDAFPDFYAAYYHKGVAELQLNQNAEALRAFQTAVDLSDGHYPRAEFGYALTLCRMGNASDAERVVRHGLETDPNSADGHVVLGVVLFTLNRLDDAEKSALEALRLNRPGSAKGRLLLADIYGARGDFDGQTRELSEYLKLFPRDRHRDLLRNLRDAAKRLGSERSASGYTDAGHSSLAN